jgi:hypothetical protein
MQEVEISLHGANTVGKNMERLVRRELETKEMPAKEKVSNMHI